jgi:methionyl aminopeptidase
MADRDLVAYRRAGAEAARAMSYAREIAASCQDERELADRITTRIRGSQTASPRWLSVGIGTNERHVNNLWRTRRPFQFGDLIKVEIGLDLGGYYVEVGETLVPWGGERADLELVETCAAALSQAIRFVRPGVRVRHIAQTIQEAVEARGFEVSLYGAGHAIRVDSAAVDNRVPPWIFNRVDAVSRPVAWRQDGREVDVAGSLETRLTPGMALSIEPIVQARGPASERRTETIPIPGVDCEVTLPYWQTTDGGKAAKFVHTVYVEEAATTILTGAPPAAAGCD